MEDRTQKSEIVFPIAMDEIAWTPWKNGQGRSRQLKIFPQTASLDSDDYIWRLSQAELIGESAFSSFRGRRRILCPVSDGQLVLEHADEMAVLKKGEILEFAGETCFKATVKGASSMQDLGLIFDPTKVSAKALAIDVKERRARSFAFLNQHILLYVLEGTGQLSLYPGEHSYPLISAQAIYLAPLQDHEIVVLLEAGSPTQKKNEQKSVTRASLKLLAIQISS